MCVCVCECGFGMLCSGILVVLKAVCCQFVHLDAWMLLVVFAKVVARLCSLSLWVALFQSFSYRQLDIACQRRQQLQLRQGQGEEWQQ